MAPLPYVWPVIGGLLIGLSASLFLLLNGRTAGISSLIARSTGLSGRRFDPASVLFLLGMVGGALVIDLFVRPATIEFRGSAITLLSAGLLIGFGTRLGSGCTSGHGICGVSRLSPRSIAATLIFMLVGMLTVYVRRHVMGAV